MKKTLFILSILIGSQAFAQSENFINQADAFFAKYVAPDGVRYQELSNSRSIMQTMTNFIAENDPSQWDSQTQQAYYINAYNILVMDKLRMNYPIKSPMDLPSFFDDNTSLVNGKQISLNTLEKKILFGIKKDPRFHFVLVCGAKGCPSIADFAYRPELLEQQLQSQTILAMNDPEFVRYNSNKNNIQLSKIFEWYADDFGGKKQSIAYINSFRENAIPENAKISYYDYDWSINESTAAMMPMDKPMGGDENKAESTGPAVISKSKMVKSEGVSAAKSDMKENATKGDVAPMQDKSGDALSAPLKTTSNVQSYTPSVLLKKGQGDITLFNSIYTQDKSRWMGEVFSGNRETFYTSLFQFTYGVSENARLNLGVDINFKSSGIAVGDESFSRIGRAFEFTNTDTTRVGLGSVGLRVKYALSKKRHFSLESSFSVPIAENGEGNFDPETNTDPYFLDWERYIWWNRFFYDKTFHGKYQLFAEADLLFRIKRNKNQNSALDTPISAFFSYFLNSKTSLYVMSQHVWRFRHSSIDEEGVTDDITTPANYTVYGFGGKYQLTDKLNVELLYSNFFRSKNAGLGETFNIGLKYLFN